MKYCTSLVFFFIASHTSAGDWPQWLGPMRDGSSPEVVAPWKTPPTVVWKQPIGEGNGSPCVAAGKVFLQAKISGKHEEEVVAFDARTGKEVWRQAYPRGAFKSPYGNGPRASPAFADGKLYTFGITGLLTCWDAETGKLIWQKDTLKEFNAKNLFFGIACSPLVKDGRVFVSVGAEGASVVALDAKNGNEIWRSQKDKASYSSPIIRGEGKNQELVFLTAAGLIGLEPAGGTLLWRYPLVDKLLESSTTPVSMGNMVMASSITFGSVGLAIEADGPKQLWKSDELTCYFATPVPVGDNLYVVTGTKPPSLSNKATLHCIDSRTGKVYWKKAPVGTYHATLLRTGDQKLLMLEESGNLVLIDPDIKEYRELCRAKVCGTTWAHPAISNGRIYLRDGKEIACLEFPK